MNTTVTISDWNILQKALTESQRDQLTAYEKNGVINIESALALDIAALIVEGNAIVVEDQQEQADDQIKTAGFDFNGTFYSGTDEDETQLIKVLRNMDDKKKGNKAGTRKMTFDNESEFTFDKDNYENFEEEFYDFRSQFVT